MELNFCKICDKNSLWCIANQESLEVTLHYWVNPHYKVLYTAQQYQKTTSKIRKTEDKVNNRGNIQFS